MYASKTVMAIAIALAAAPAIAQSLGEPLEAREDLSLAGNARSVNFVRSVGEAIGMKRSEVEDILAREFHHKHHGHRHGHKHHGHHHDHKHLGGFRFRPHHRPHPHGHHGHHHVGHEHEHEHFGGVHHARGEGAAHAAAAHGHGTKPHRHPGHKPAFKPHGRKHGHKHGRKHGPHGGNRHGHKQGHKHGAVHHKGAKPAHAAAQAARALIERAQPSDTADESGAFNFFDVLGMLRREDIEMLERADFGNELMMREAMETRNLEELD